MVNENAKEGLWVDFISDLQMEIWFEFNYNQRPVWVVDFE